MVNAYWDIYFGVNGLTVTRVSGPTWAMNCYGYATGLDYWVQGPVCDNNGPVPGSGINVVLRYDWEQCQTTSDIQVGNVSTEGSDHAIRIDGAVDYSPYRVISETSEKMAYAGVYKKLYYLPGGANIYIGGMHKKK